MGWAPTLPPGLPRFPPRRVDWRLWRQRAGRQSRMPTLRPRNDTAWADRQSTIAVQLGRLVSRRPSCRFLARGRVTDAHLFLARHPGRGSRHEHMWSSWSRPGLVLRGHGSGLRTHGKCRYRAFRTGRDPSHPVAFDPEFTRYSPDRTAVCREGRGASSEPGLVSGLSF